MYDFRFQMSLRSFTPINPPPLLGEHFNGVISSQRVRGSFVTPFAVKSSAQPEIVEVQEVLEARPPENNVGTSEGEGSQKVTTNVRKCCVCKQPVKGHKGPYGRNKCKNGKVNVGEFLDSEYAVPITIEVYATPPGSPASYGDDYETPPRLSIPAEVYVTPPPLYIPVPSQRSALCEDQDLVDSFLPDHASSGVNTNNPQVESESTNKSDQMSPVKPTKEKLRKKMRQQLTNLKDLHILVRS